MHCDSLDASIASKENEIQVLYSLNDFIKSSMKSFGVSQECIIAAFKHAGKDKTTLAEAKEIIKKFMDMEVN